MENFSNVKDVVRNACRILKRVSKNVEIKKDIISVRGIGILASLIEEFDNEDDQDEKEIRGYGRKALHNLTAE